MWRESCGFEAALAAISSLDAAFSPTTGRRRQTPVSASTNTSTTTTTDGNAGEKRGPTPTPSSDGDDHGRPALAGKGDNNDDDGGDDATAANDVGGDGDGNGDGVSTRESFGGGGGSGDATSDDGGGCCGVAVSDEEEEEARVMEAEHFRVIQAALFTLVASASAGPMAVLRGERLVGYRANRRYLRREISYDSLACCLVNSGVVARCVRMCMCVCFFYVVVGLVVEYILIGSFVCVLCACELTFLLLYPPCTSNDMLVSYRGMVSISIVLVDCYIAFRTKKELLRVCVCVCCLLVVA